MRIHYWLLVVSSTQVMQVRAQNLSRAEMEERFRSLLSDLHAIHLTVGPDREPPIHERLLKIGQLANMSRSDVEALLLKLTEEGIQGSSQLNEKTSRVASKLAGGALSALGYIGEEAIINDLMRFAEVAPEHLSGGTTRALIYVVNREAPNELPAVVRRLTQGRNEGSPVYDHLETVVRH